MSDEHDAFLFDEEEDDAFAYEEEEDTGKKSATQNDKSSKAKRTSSVESRGKHEKKRFETPPRAYGQKASAATAASPVTPGAVRSRLKKLLNSMTTTSLQSISAKKVKNQLEEDFDTNLDSHAPLIREAVKAFVVGPSKTSTSPLSKQKSPLYSPPRTSSASSTTESEQTKAQAPKRVLHRTASKESSSTVILDSSQSELNDSQKEGSSAVLDLTTTEDDVIKGTVQKQIKKEPKHHGRSVQFQEDSDEEPYTQRATTGSKKNKTAKQPSASHSAATKSRKRKQPVEDDQEHDDGTDERNHSVPESSANAENGTDKKRATEAVGASSKKLASSLPLTVAPGVARRQRTTVLVQVDCDEDLLNISGDVGSIGRMNTTDNGIILDLQGHRYAGTIAPSLSHMVVGITPKEAKVESVTNDFVQLDHLQNVIEEMKGTMTEGSEDIKELFRVEDVDAMGDINDDDDDRPISRVSSTNKEETDGEQDASARGTKSKKRKQKASSRPTQMIGKARKASTNRSKKSSKKS